MSNDSRSVLVTGASGGIGRAVCARLAQSGRALVLAARDEGRLLALCDELRSIRPGRYEAIPVDMGDDAAVAAFGERLVDQGTVLDGVVMMPPQMPPTNDCMPPNDTWRTLFQRSFIGPLGLLKAAIPAMQPDPAQGQRVKVVIISAITSVQALGNYATSNVLRCAWLAEAKTLAFALGARGIHINTLSLGATLTPDYIGLGATARRAGGRQLRSAPGRRDLEHSAGQVRQAGRSCRGRRATARCNVGSHDRRELAARRRIHARVLSALNSRTARGLVSWRVGCQLCGITRRGCSIAWAIGSGHR